MLPTGSPALGRSYVAREILGTVQVRPVSSSDESDDNRINEASGPAGAGPEQLKARHQNAGFDQVSFAVPGRVIALKFGLAVLLLLLGLIGLDRSQMVAGLIAALAVAAYASRDLVARERVRADRDGVVAVRGFAGRRRLAWSEIEQVRVDQRTRYGAGRELLEIDAGEEIYLFSRYDLGVDASEAAEAMDAVRRSR